MIMFTREEAQQLMDLFDMLDPYDAFSDVRGILYTKLLAHDPVRVSPNEFIAAATGKENLTGMPVMWAEWPTRETA